MTLSDPVAPSIQCYAICIETQKRPVTVPSACYVIILIK